MSKTTECKHKMKSAFFLLKSKNGMKHSEERAFLLKMRQQSVKKMVQCLENLDIGNDIRLRLRVCDFLEQDLADMINCDRSNISKIIRRKNHFSLIQLVQISVALEHNFFNKVFELLKNIDQSQH